MQRLCPLFRRAALAACAALALFATPARAADASLTNISPAWRDAESATRIGEFLGGPEKSASRTLLRTQPATRDGYYFVFRARTAAALTAGAKFELSVIRPDAPEAKRFAFPVTAPAGSSVFELGLTGTDWPGGSAANPVAWKLTLLAADGRVLTEYKSFLWEKPAK